MGEAFCVISSFDAFSPSYDFGFRFVSGSGNGPGTGGSQFYSWYIGLGSQYVGTGGGSNTYGAMFAVDRNTACPIYRFVLASPILLALGENGVRLCRRCRNI